MRLHQEQVPLPGQRRPAARRRAASSVERLLAQHRLARLEGQLDVLAVQRVRGGDVHHVHVGVLDQRAVVAVRRGRCRARRRTRRRTPAGARRRPRPRTRRAARRSRHERVGDLAGGEDAPPHRAVAGQRLGADRSGGTSSAGRSSGRSGHRHIVAAPDDAGETPRGERTTSLWFVAYDGVAPDLPTSHRAAQESPHGRRERPDPGHAPPRASCPSGTARSSASSASGGSTPAPRSRRSARSSTCPSTRYYQVLNALIDRPEALAFDPLLVRRLRRLRAARQRARSARRLGFEV